MNELCRIGINLVTVVALAAGAVTAQGQKQELASEMSDVLLFDTGAALAGELPSAALAERAGWVKVEEDAAPGQFKGDVVFLNGRIAVVLRKIAAGAEIYSHSAKGWQRRALLAARLDRDSFLRRPARFPTIRTHHRSSWDAACNATGRRSSRCRHWRDPS